MENKKFKEYIDEVNDIDFEMRDKINIDSSNTFGIEIEFEKVKIDDIKYGKKWKVKEDCTTTKQVKGINIGGEVSSPILKDTKECWQDIKHICQYLSKKGAIVTSSTGGHIHIGSQVLKNDPDNIRRLLKQWELFEHVIYSFSSGRDQYLREIVSVQAKKISPRLRKIRNTKYGYNKYQTYYDWYQFFIDFQLNKFEGLNFKNYRGWEEDYENTIEIRCPNGTLDPVIWQNNINFFVKFFENCCNDSFDEEYIDYLLDKKASTDYENNYNIIDIQGAIELSNLIFKDRIDKIMFLKQYLKLFDGKCQKQYVKNKNHSV